MSTLSSAQTPSGSASHDFGYGWLDADRAAGAAVTQASCFSFFRGVSVDQVVARGHLREVRRLDLSRAPNALEHPPDTDGSPEVAVFEQDGWTVVWQENGYPEQFADSIAAGADETTIAYWNVNAENEFSYWENGKRVLGFTFDDPGHPSGTVPRRLQPALDDTVLKPITAGEGTSAIPQYRRLLALSERITTIHLGPAFLNRSSVVIGHLPDSSD